MIFPEWLDQLGFQTFNSAIRFVKWPKSILIVSFNNWGNFNTISIFLSTLIMEVWWNMWTNIFASLSTLNSNAPSFLWPGGKIPRADNMGSDFSNCGGSVATAGWEQPKNPQDNEVRSLFGAAQWQARRPSYSWNRKCDTWTKRWFRVAISLSLGVVWMIRFLCGSQCGFMNAIVWCGKCDILCSVAWYLCDTTLSHLPSAERERAPASGGGGGWCKTGILLWPL